MRLRKILAVSMAATVAISSFMVSMTAEATYASPTEMIEEILYTACTGIDIDAAWNTLEPLITVDGNEIKLNGVSIGYWDSDTIYSDSSLSTVYAEQTGDGVECNKTFLSTILDGLNQNIVETYSPATTDWSKIVGKYDVTVDDITISADRWVKLTSGEEVDVNSQFGLPMKAFSSSGSSCAFFSYAIDNAGELYIGASYGIASADGAPPYSVTWTESNATKTNTSRNFWSGICTADTSAAFTQVKKRYDSVGYLKATVELDSTSLTPVLNMYDSAGDFLGTSMRFQSILKKVGDVNQVIDPAEIKEYGIVSIPKQSRTATNFGSANYFVNLLSENFTASKTVVGNSAITKRLGKLRALNAGDTVTVTPTAWLVNGTENIDDYIALTEITTAGTPASMQGSVDVEPLNFKVIVPAYLPMSVDPSGNVTTATNASIENRSNAPVQITALDIAASALGGWTLVDSSPSKTRGANEFTFNTSLAVGNTIEQGETLGFTYSAEMSPVEEGIDNIDIVTLTVTLDWEE